MDYNISQRYRLKKKIGHGSFGEIYTGVDTITNTEVAIKLESITLKNPQLAFEATTYKYLQEGVGFPQVYYYGPLDSYKIMVMDLLGPSLSDMFHYCNCKFSVKTVCMLAQEMLLRLEFMHKNGFIHRDMKPDNFVLGVNEMANVVYIIDLGLSKRYRSTHSNSHILYRESKNLTGTPRYASISNHLGIEQSRRDDLESLGYILVYFLKGLLPWQGLRANNKREKYNRILESKVNVKLTDLCSDLPWIFYEYLNYCRGLRFDEEPDYLYLRSLFSDYMKEEHMENDGLYDWLQENDNHILSEIPRFCVTSEGKLGKGLDKPAKRQYTVAMLKSELTDLNLDLNLNGVHDDGEAKEVSDTTMSSFVDETSLNHPKHGKDDRDDHKDDKSDKDDKFDKSDKDDKSDKFDKFDNSEHRATRGNSNSQFASNVCPSTLEDPQHIVESGLKEVSETFSDMHSEEKKE